MGAVALGFNFYPPSPRSVDPAVASGIIAQLPPLILPVGIFANETDEERVVRTATESKVRAVQLHGPQFPSITGTLARFPLIRAVAVKEGFRPEILCELGGNTFLLDAFDAELIGGTGKPFNWTLAQEASRYATIILAGGLTPENVGQAIREVRPFAVDVASGIEATPGKKDPAKMHAFFAAVAEADQSLGR